MHVSVCWNLARHRCKPDEVCALGDHALSRHDAFEHLHDASFSCAELYWPSEKCLAGLLHKDDWPAAIINDGGLRNDGSDICGCGKEAHSDGLVHGDSAVAIIQLVDDRERAGRGIDDATNRNKPL